MAAMSTNNCIGVDNDLPWDIPEDKERMRSLILGKVVIMGRKTWESIPIDRRGLPDRTDIVITGQSDYELPSNVERYDTVAQALEKHEGEEIIGFGGQRIFEEMIEYADMLDITHVDIDIPECHAYFPLIDKNIWKETWREDHEGFSFVQYIRK